MISFKVWLEAKKTEKKPQSDTNKVDAVMDLAKGVQSVFKKYSLQTRKYAWKKIHSAKADDLFQGLLVNPNKSLSPFKTLSIDSK